MKERPILFSASMVRAILEGRKTATRRVSGLDVINAEPDRYRFLGMVSGPETPHAAFHDKTSGAQVLVRSPYGQPGDLLWVRETWMPDAPRDGAWADFSFYGCKGSPLSEIPERYRKPEHCLFRATWDGFDMVGWKPSIHMPRWASRITLEVTRVRVERLQDISEADAIAEGAEPFRLPVHPDREELRHVDGFRKLWESINGAGSWDDDPFVWVVEFKRVGA